MKLPSLLLMPVLALSLVACGDEKPERDFSRPPEYRSQMGEYLLKEQAKHAMERRAAREKMAEVRRDEMDSKLTEIPPDFPRAFTTFPGAEWRNGFSVAPVTMVALAIDESVEDAFKRVQQAAQSDGWTLEAVVDDDAQAGGPQASFQKGTQRVDVLITPLPESGAQVVSRLTQLEPPPAAPAP